MSGYMPYTPGMMPAGLSSPMDIQNRIQQLQQMQQQFQPAQQPQMPQQNVNWIQVSGIDGAKNQIVQPGTTAWMMDNNAPVFYVKSADAMGTATFKAFRFEEISPDVMTAPQQTQNYDNRYVTREEFQELLTKLGEPTEGGLTNEQSVNGDDGRKFAEK